MALRRLAPAVALSLVLGACSAAPAERPSVDPADTVDSGPAAVLDQARTVANDLEQRNLEIESQMRDPFSPP